LSFTRLPRYSPGSSTAGTCAGRYVMRQWLAPLISGELLWHSVRRCADQWSTLLPQNRAIPNLLAAYRVLDVTAPFLTAALSSDLRIRPGKPTHKVVVEAFNSRFRQECLNERWFLSVAEGQVRAELWRKHYNGERPHSSRENLTPEQFANQSIAGHPLGDGQTATQPPAMTCQPEEEFCLVWRKTLTAGGSKTGSTP